MQKILYFCIVKGRIRIILAILFLLPSFQGRAGDRPSFNLDDIVLDIYNAATEIGEVDYEQLQTDLYALHEAPINLNNTSDEELQQLYFLSPQQIDDILAYADRHPFETLYELRMIQSLADYEIRDLLPFVRIGARASEQNIYAREVFAHAGHEIITRADARSIEDFEGTDPMYIQTRYRFDYQRRVTFGAPEERRKSCYTEPICSFGTSAICIPWWRVIFRPLSVRVWCWHRFFIPANRCMLLRQVRVAKDCGITVL